MNKQNYQNQYKTVCKSMYGVATWLSHFCVLFAKINFLKRLRSLAPSALGLGILAVLIVSPLLTSSSTAAPSTELNFQGRLLSDAGALVLDGDYHIEFNLYNVATGGTTQWTETYTTGNLVRIANGYMTVQLGSITPFPSGIDWSEEQWLTINIGGTGGSPVWDGEMNPRLKVTSVPYAFAAGTATVLEDTDAGNTTTVSIDTPTANNAILFPDDSGTVCLTSGNCSGVGGTGDILDGGNTTGSAVVVGTNDANDFALEAGGITRLTIDDGTGLVTLEGDLLVDTGLVTVGNATQAGTVEIHDGSGNKVTVGTATLAADATYNFASAATGTYDICTTAGNCSGTGGGGSIGGGGTNGTIPVFTPDGFNIGDSIMTQSGGIVDIGGGLTVDGNLTLGDANTDTITINSGTSGAGVIFSDSSFASCSALETDASGNLTCGTDDTAAGTAGANIDATDLAAGTISVVDAPTFAGLVSAQLGLTITAGQDFTVNNEAFTDLTGNGLGITAGALGINAPTCSGTDKLSWDGTAFTCETDVDTDDQILALNLGTNIVTLSNGDGADTTADLSSYLDNTDAQTISLDGGTNVLTLGNGTAADTTVNLSAYLDNTDALDSLTCADNQIAKWNNAGSIWECATDEVDDADSDITNEIQTLAWNSGTDELSISGTGGNTITLGYLQTEVDGVIGNEILNATTNGGLVRAGSGTAGDPFTLGLQACSDGEVLQYTQGTSTWSCADPAGIGTNYTAGTNIDITSGVISVLNNPTFSGLVTANAGVDVSGTVDIAQVAAGNVDIKNGAQGKWTAVIPTAGIWPTNGSDRAVGYIEVGETTSYATTLEIGLSGNWSSGPAFGRVTKLVSYYYNGAGAISNIETQVSEAFGRVQDAYVIGDPEVNGSTVRIPVYRLNATTTTGLGVEVNVYNSSASNRDEVIDSLSITNPVLAANSQVPHTLEVEGNELCTAAGNCGSAGLTAGTNIDITSGVISVLNNPTFSGLVTANAGIDLNNSNLDDVQNIYFDESNSTIYDNSFGLIFDGGDGTNDFLVYDNQIYSDVLRLGYSGAAEIITNDTNEDLLINPNGTGAINITGTTVIDGGDSVADFQVTDAATQTNELRLGLNSTALLTTVDTNENLYIDPNGSGFTQVSGGSFYVTDATFLRGGVSNDTGNLAINDSADISGALTTTGLTTLNGGLTVQAGDTFTFNGDAFTDLTGTGLEISAGALQVDSTICTTAGNCDGGNITGFTSGSVLFANTDGSITEDNANFFYDNVNDRFGIGTTNPSAALDVVGQDVELYSNTTTQNVSIGRNTVENLELVVNDNNGWIILNQDETDATQHNIVFDIQSASTSDSAYLFRVNDLDVATLNEAGALTVGRSNLAGGVSIYDGSSNTGTFQTAALSANQTYTLPNETGTVCLSSGNCGASGLTAGTNIDITSGVVSVIDNPTFAGLVTANSSLNVTGNATATDKFISSRYGYAGTYNSSQVQGIWSIGDAFEIDTVNNDFGTQYGLGYAYNQNGGSPFASQHQIVYTNNGVVNAAVGLTSGTGYFKGSLGVGTTTPDRKLDITDSADGFAGIKVNNLNSGSSTSSGIELYNNGNALTRIYGERATNDTIIRNLQTVSGDILFQTNNGATTPLELQYDGDLNADGGTFFVEAATNEVGVGTANPTNALTVVDATTNVSNTALSVIGTDTASANGTYYNIGLQVNQREAVASGITDSGYVLGGDFSANNTGAGTLATSYGLRTASGVASTAPASSVTTNAVGVYARTIAQAGTVVNGYGLRSIVYDSGTGNLQNGYALYLEDVDASISQYGVYQVGANDINHFAGVINANGGLTVQTGDTLTVNGDAFTDLTGTGLEISAGALQVDSTICTTSGNCGASGLTAGTNIDITSGVISVLNNPTFSGLVTANASIDLNGSNILDSTTVSTDHIADRDRGDTAITLSDEYLRINQSNSFHNGVWFGTSDIKFNTGDILVGTTGGSNAAVEIRSGNANANYITIDGTIGSDSYFNTGGNFGIGTTAPSVELEIENLTDAAILLQADSDNVGEADNAYVEFSQDGAAIRGLIGTTGNAGFSPKNSAYTNALANTLLVGTTTVNTPLQFGTNNAVALTVDTSQNIGIGTTAPSAKLDVVGSSELNGTLQVTGTATFGNSTTAALLSLQDGSGQVGNIFTTDLTANRNYTLPDATGEICVSGAGNCQSSYEDNLLRNGDFEFGLENWTELANIAIRTDLTHSGGKSYEVTGRANITSGDLIPVDPDYDVLQLEAWIYEEASGTEGGNLYFGYAAYDINQTLITSSPCGTYCYFAASNSNVAPGSWQKYSATTTGEGTSYPNFPVGTKFVRILGLINYLNSSDDQVTLIDNVSITRINNGPLFAGNNVTGTNQVNQNQASKIFTTAADTLVLQTPGTGSVQLGSSATGLQIAQDGSISDIDGARVEFSESIGLGHAGNGLIYAKDSGGTSRAVLYGRWSNNATYLDGGTGGLYLRTNNSAQNAAYFNASGNVTFYGNTTTDGSAIVTGLTTLNGGLTVQTGDTFTFNGDAFTDLTGTGLTISAGALQVDNTICTTAGNCSGVGGTGDILDGGNSTGSTVVVGTNDTNDFILETDGAARLTIDSTGDVGIGVASPAYSLDVSGDSRIDGALILGAAGAGYIDDDTTLGGYTAADDWLRLNGYIEAKSNTDNYGIVLRDSDSTSYLGLTQVGGTSYFADTNTSANYFLRGNGSDVFVRGVLTSEAGSIIAGSNAVAGSTTYYDGSSNTGTIETAALSANQTYTLPNSSGTVCLTSGNCAGVGGQVGGSGTANRVAYWSTAADITADDDLYFNGTNLGVGTTSPGYRLEVNSGSSDYVAEFESNDAFGGIRLTDPTETWGLTSYNGEFRIRDGGGATDPLRISNNAPTNSFFIASDGDIGIGNAAPAYKLDVDGSFDLNQGTYRVTSNASGSALYALTLNRGGVDLYPQTGTLALGRDASNSDLEIEADGDINLSGGTLFVDESTSRVGIGTTTPAYTLDVATGNARLGNGYSITSATPSITNGSPYALLHTDGTALNGSYQYTVTLNTTSTGTDSGSRYLVWYDADTSLWNTRFISRAGSGSNHPEVFLDSGVPKVKIDHASTYPVRVTTEAIFTNDSDSSPHLQGADYQWQRSASSLFYADGNVGIGTTNPAAPLEVVGESRLDDVTIGAAITLSDTNSVSSAADILFGVSGVVAAEEDLYINVDSDNDKANGFLRIGSGTQTSSATQLFQVSEDGITRLGNTALAGQLSLYDGSSHTGSFLTSPLSANRTYTLPNVSGTVCLDSGNCAGAGLTAGTNIAISGGTISTIASPEFTNVDITAGNDNGIRFWNGSTSYTITMGNDQDDHGSVTDYSIHTNIGGVSTRGITWGNSDTNVVASLNATSGNFATDGSIVVGNGANIGGDTLTANNQNDVVLFGNATGSVAQSGNFDNKLKLLGGGGQSRSLELYQDYNGYATLDTSWTGNRLEVSSNFAQFNVDSAVTNISGTATVSGLLTANGGIDLNNNNIDDVQFIYFDESNSRIADNASGLTFDGGDGTPEFLVYDNNIYSDVLRLGYTGAATITTYDTNENLNINTNGSGRVIISPSNAGYTHVSTGTFYVENATRLRGSISDDLNGDLSFDDSTTTTGLATFNGGILLQTGDTLTVNGDAFTDLTGTGLTVSSGALQVDEAYLDENYADREGFSTTLTTTGWYRIASNGPVADGASGGNRATGRFNILDTASGRHSSTTVYASTTFGVNPTLTLLNRSSFGSGGVIKKVRIVEGGTYEGAAVEVYFDNGGVSSAVEFYLYDDDQTAGWTPINWTAGSVPTGFATTDLDFDTFDPVLATASATNDNGFVVDRQGDVTARSIDLLSSALVSDLDGAGLAISGGVLSVDSTVCTTSGNCAGAGLTAGTNIALSGGTISVINNPTFSGLVTASAGIALSDDNITGVQEIRFNDSSSHSITSNASGLIFDGGDGSNDFLVYDNQVYSDVLRLGYSGSASIITNDTNESLSINPNGTGAINISGATNITGDLAVISNGPTQNIRGFNNTLDSDIAGLLTGTTSGGLTEAPVNAHQVIGLRENGVTDGFAVVSGGGNWNVDSTYDRLVLFAGAGGNVGLGTATPGATLDVVGTAAVSGATTVSGLLTAESGLVVDGSGDAIVLDGGHALLSVHDGNGNFSILNGINGSNVITATSGGTRLELSEAGSLDVEIYSGSVGATGSEAASYNFGGTELDISSANIDLNGNLDTSGTAVIGGLATLSGGINLPGTATVTDLDGTGLTVSSGVLGVDSTICNTSGNCGGLGLVAGTNIALSGGTVSVINNPTFSGLVTANGGLDVEGSFSISKAPTGNHYYPSVAQWNSNVNNLDGALAIGLPNVGVSMNRIVITGYNYDGVGSWEVVVGGYNYNVADNTWINESVEIRGSAPFDRVRLMRSNDASDIPYIVLGEDTDLNNWDYPQVDVSINAGYSSQASQGTGWTVQLSTDLSASGLNLVAEAEPVIEFYQSAAGNIGIGGVTGDDQLEVVTGNLDISTGSLELNDVTRISNAGAFTGTTATFSGLLTANAGIALSDDNITGVQEIRFNDSSSHSITSNASGLIFDGGDGSNDFLVYDNQVYSDVLRLGYSGSASIITNDTNESLSINPNGTGAINISGDTNVTGTITTTAATGTNNVLNVTDETSYAEYRYQGDGTNKYSLGVYGDTHGSQANDFYLYQYTDSADATVNAYRLLVDGATGNLGVGTGSPNYKLDVAGEIRATSNIRADDKVITSRYGSAGTYNSSQVQGIWSIGDAYQIDVGADDFGTQYGLGYAYSTNGGAPFVNQHQIVFTNNGVVNAAIGLTSGTANFSGNVEVGDTLTVGAGSAGSAGITTHGTNETLVLSTNGNGHINLSPGTGGGYTYVNQGTFYVQNSTILRGNVSDDAGNLTLADTVDVTGALNVTGSTTLTGLLTANAGIALSNDNITGVNELRFNSGANHSIGSDTNGLVFDGGDGTADLRIEDSNVYGPRFVLGYSGVAAISTFDTNEDLLIDTNGTGSINLTPGAGNILLGPSTGEVNVTSDINIGTTTTNSSIKAYGTSGSDQIEFYNGSTLVGEIGTQDTTWLRINQTTNKNIYTPRYIRADGGFFIDGTTYGLSGTGALQALAGSVGEAEIAQNTLDDSEIQDNSLTAASLAAGSVGTSEVAADSLTAADLANGAVGTGEIANGAIQEVDLEVTNAATDNYILSYDSATAGFTWVQDQGTSYTAGTNISISGGAINVVNNPTFSGLLTASSGLNVSGGNIYNSSSANVTVNDNVRITNASLILNTSGQTDIGLQNIAGNLWIDAGINLSNDNIQGVNTLGGSAGLDLLLDAGNDGIIDLEVAGNAIRTGTVTLGDNGVGTGRLETAVLNQNLEVLTNGGNIIINPGAGQVDLLGNLEVTGLLNVGTALYTSTSATLEIQDAIEVREHLYLADSSGNNPIDIAYSAPGLTAINSSLNVTGTINGFGAIYSNSTVHANTSLRTSLIYLDGTSGSVTVGTSAGSANSGLYAGNLYSNYATPVNNTTYICWSSTTDLVGRCSSRADLKENVNDLSLGLDTINQLRPVSYNWISGGDADLGFIAEEVAAVNPLLATYHEDTGDIIGVKYAHSVALAINGIQELDAKHEVLAVTVADNTSRIDALEAAVFDETFTDLTVTATATIASLTVTTDTELQGDLLVVGDTEVQGSLTVARIVSAGDPITATAGIDLDINDTVVIDGNDTAGTLTIALDPASIAALGEVIAADFVADYDDIPRVALTAKDASSAGIRVYVETTDTGFKVFSIDALTPGATYTFDYIIIQ